jgi:hypothetical protein
MKLLPKTTTPITVPGTAAVVLAAVAAEAVAVAQAAAAEAGGNRVALTLIITAGPPADSHPALALGLPRPLRRTPASTALLLLPSTSLG